MFKTMINHHICSYLCAYSGTWTHCPEPAYRSRRRDQVTCWTTEKYFSDSLAGARGLTLLQSVLTDAVVDAAYCSVGANILFWE